MFCRGSTRKKKSKGAHARSLKGLIHMGYTAGSEAMKAVKAISMLAMVGFVGWPYWTEEPEKLSLAKGLVNSI